MAGLNIYKSLILPLLLFSVVLCVYADEAASRGDERSDSSPQGEAAVVLNQDEAAFKVDEVPLPRSADRSTAAMLIQLVLSLAAICALVYGVLYFIRRSKRFTAGDDPFLKNVARLTVAPNKMLCVVTLIDKAYVIGVSDSSLSLIAEVTDKELIDAMNLHAAQSAEQPQPFSSFLHTFFPAAKPARTDTGLFESFLAKQRSRLKNADVSSDVGEKE